MALVLAVSITAACSSSSDWFEYGGDSLTGTDDGDPGPAAGGQPSIEPPPVSTAAATVVRVIDGDSLEVEHDGREIEVRLRGFNAPELYGKSADGTNVETCQGAAARRALESLARPGSRILLVVDETAESDRFGRTLADLTSVVAPGDKQPTQSVVAAMVSGGGGLATGDESFPVWSNARETVVLVDDNGVFVDWRFLDL